MKREIGSFLFVTLIILAGAGSTTAQPDAAAEFDEVSSLPMGTLLESPVAESFPLQEERSEAYFRQGNDFVIPKATEGFDEQKVLQDPLCDPTSRPTIETITPDEVRPGDTITVTGTYFGAKIKCLRSVTLGEYAGENLTLLEDNVFRIRVPKELRAGLVFLSVVTSGGSARSVILIKG